MSIVTLKRKTQAQYKNSSVGHPAFSLNGTRRSAGYVGQDTLGRSLIRSLSKNGALKGHGGSCGKYPIYEVKTSPEMACLNDTTAVKTSSLNTNGLIMSKYRWIRRPQPYSSTKSNSYLNSNSQSSYIDNLARKTISEVDDEDCQVVRSIVPNTCCSRTNYNINSNRTPHIVKSDEYTGAINSGDHIRKMNMECSSNDLFKIPTTIKRTPFGRTSTSYAPIGPVRSTVRTPGIIAGTSPIA
jgi:hypothetical protein